MKGGKSIMEVSLAVLADYSNVSKEGKLNILGIFDIIRARNFPAIHHNMQLVITFEAPRTEVNTEKNIQVKLIDSDGKLILEIGSQFIVPKNAPGEMTVKSNHVLNLNDLLFEKPGDYAFSILINSEEKKSVPLKLVQIE
jgi:hypothetical protein